MRPTALLLSLAATVLASFAIALSSGSAGIGLHDAWLAMTGEAPPPVRALVLELRLPRALTAFAVGGLLAVSGVFMQVLLRNPLAEPYILGTSGGAAVGALGALSLGLGSVATDSFAFGGALASALLVFVVARGTGNFAPTRLLLTGVVLSAGFSAAIALILSLSPDQALRGMLFWLMGDLSFAFEPGRLLLLLLLMTAGGIAGAGYLNVLARGGLQAAILGLPVNTVRLTLFATTALAVALSVTSVGVVGFIGLVIPHLVRLVAGSGHRVLVPAAVLAGGALLLVADTLARSIIAPRQLPVGALTAALGVPLFLYLMSRSPRPGGEPGGGRGMSGAVQR